MNFPVIKFFPEERRKEEVILPPPIQKQEAKASPRKFINVKKPVIKLPESMFISEGLSISLSDYINSGERDAIIASSGMGKSYLMGVIMEETLETGGLLCVIDPEGEHYTLGEKNIKGEKYPIMIIGGNHANLPLDPERIESYINTALTKGISILFDLSDDIEHQDTYALIAQKLFDRNMVHKTKIRIIIDEAQTYAPQSGNGTSACLEVSKILAKRGRKHGVDSLWATQRPASINKDIISQCNRFWFGGITAEQDYKAIKPFLSDAGISHDQLKALKSGEFYFFRPGKSPILIKVRTRYCKHGGSTPQAKKRKRISQEEVREVISKLKKE